MDRQVHHRTGIECLKIEVHAQAVLAMLAVWTTPGVRQLQLNDS